MLMLLLAFHLPVRVDPDFLREPLRNRIENAVAVGDLQCGDEHLVAASWLTGFYIARNFETVWFDNQHEPGKIDLLLTALEGAADHGLEARDYHYNQLKAFLARFREQPPGKRNPRLAVDLELLASDGFALYAGHLIRGCVNPETYDPDWLIERREVDMPALLASVHQAPSVVDLLQGLAPKHPHYARLQAALKLWRSREKEDNWTPLDPGPVIKPGMRHPQVELVRRRFQPDAPASDLYDKALADVVADYQRRHGLDADAYIGAQTRELLNRTPRAKIAQIKANLERWRWLPQSFGDAYILVNIAAYELHLLEDGVETLTGAVIVGRPFRRTPVFSADMRYLVLSPYWHVPPSLVLKDKLPELRKDAARMKGLGFRAFVGWGDNAEEVDITSVDWRKTPSPFPYRLRQDPGPQNALGKVKFMFPNRFNVYLHDTPTQELFQKAVRSFSSGCIRVEKPMELAAHLLRDQPAWTPARLEEVVASGKETTVMLKKTFRVYLVYWTVKVQGEDVFFLPDIYERDTVLAAGLEAVQLNDASPP